MSNSSSENDKALLISEIEETFSSSLSNNPKIQDDGIHLFSEDNYALSQDASTIAVRYGVDSNLMSFASHHSPTETSESTRSAEEEKKLERHFEYFISNVESPELYELLSLEGGASAATNAAAVHTTHNTSTSTTTNKNSGGGEDSGSSSAGGKDEHSTATAKSRLLELKLPSFVFDSFLESIRTSHPVLHSAVSQLPFISGVKSGNGNSSGTGSNSKKQGSRKERRKERREADHQKQQLASAMLTSAVNSAGGSTDQQQDPTGQGGAALAGKKAGGGARERGASSPTGSSNYGGSINGSIGGGSSYRDTDHLPQVDAHKNRDVLSILIAKAIAENSMPTYLLVVSMLISASKDEETRCLDGVTVPIANLIAALFAKFKETALSDEEGAGTSMNDDGANKSSSSSNNNNNSPGLAAACAVPNPFVHYLMATDTMATIRHNFSHHSDLSKYADSYAGSVDEMQSERSEATSLYSGGTGRGGGGGGGHMHLGMGRIHNRQSSGRSSSFAAAYSDAGSVGGTSVYAESTFAEVGTETATEMGAASVAEDDEEVSEEELFAQALAMSMGGSACSGTSVCDSDVGTAGGGGVALAQSIDRPLGSEVSGHSERIGAHFYGSNHSDVHSSHPGSSNTSEHGGAGSTSCQFPHTTLPTPMSASAVSMVNEKSEFEVPAYVPSVSPMSTFGPFCNQEFWSKTYKNTANLLTASAHNNVAAGKVAANSLPIRHVIIALLTLVGYSADVFGEEESATKPFEQGGKCSTGERCSSTSTNGAGLKSPVLSPVYLSPSKALFNLCEYLLDILMKEIIVHCGNNILPATATSASAAAGMTNAVASAQEEWYFHLYYLMWSATTVMKVLRVSLGAVLKIGCSFESVGLGGTTSKSGLSSNTVNFFDTNGFSSSTTPGSTGSGVGAGARRSHNTPQRTTPSGLSLSSSPSGGGAGVLLDSAVVPFVRLLLKRVLQFMGCENECVFEHILSATNGKNSDSSTPVTKATGTTTSSGGGLGLLGSSLQRSMQSFASTALDRALGFYVSNPIGEIGCVDFEPPIESEDNVGSSFSSSSPSATTTPGAIPYTRSIFMKGSEASAAAGSDNRSSTTESSSSTASTPSSAGLCAPSTGAQRKVALCYSATYFRHELRTAAIEAFSTGLSIFFNTSAKRVALVRYLLRNAPDLLSTDIATATTTPVKSPLASSLTSIHASFSHLNNGGNFLKLLRSHRSFIAKSSLSGTDRDSGPAVASLISGLPDNFYKNLLTQKVCSELVDVEELFASCGDNSCLLSDTLRNMRISSSTRSTCSASSTSSSQFAIHSISEHWQEVEDIVLERFSRSSQLMPNITEPESQHLLFWGELQIIRNFQIIRSNNYANALSLFKSNSNALDMRFDGRRCHLHMNLSSDGGSVLHRGPRLWCSVLGSIGFEPNSGKYEWYVRIDRCSRGHVFVGIGTKDAVVEKDAYVGIDKQSWGLIGTRSLWHNRSKIGTEFGTGFSTDSVLCLSLDTKAGTLSYRCADQSWGIAFENLPKTTLFPAFSLHEKDDQLSMLCCYKLVDDVSSEGAVSSNTNSNYSSNRFSGARGLGFTGFRASPSVMSFSAALDMERDFVYHAQKVFLSVNSLLNTAEAMLLQGQVGSAVSVLRHPIIGVIYASICAFLASANHAACKTSVSARMSTFALSAGITIIAKKLSALYDTLSAKQQEQQQQQRPASSPKSAEHVSCGGTWIIRKELQSMSAQLVQMDLCYASSSSDPAATPGGGVGAASAASADSPANLSSSSASHRGYLPYPSTQAPADGLLVTGAGAVGVFQSSSGHRTGKISKETKTTIFRAIQSGTRLKFAEYTYSGSNSSRGGGDISTSAGYVVGSCRISLCGSFLSGKYRDSASGMIGYIDGHRIAEDLGISSSSCKTEPPLDILLRKALDLVFKASILSHHACGELIKAMIVGNEAEKSVALRQQSGTAATAVPLTTPPIPESTPSLDGGNTATAAANVAASANIPSTDEWLRADLFSGGLPLNAQLKKDLCDKLLFHFRIPMSEEEAPVSHFGAKIDGRMGGKGGTAFTIPASGKNATDSSASSRHRATPSSGSMLLLNAEETAAAPPAVTAGIDIMQWWLCSIFPTLSDTLKECFNSHNMETASIKASATSDNLLPTVGGSKTAVRAPISPDDPISSQFYAELMAGTGAGAAVDDFVTLHAGHSVVAKIGGIHMRNARTAILVALLRHSGCGVQLCPPHLLDYYATSSTAVAPTCADPSDEDGAASFSADTFTQHDGGGGYSAAAEIDDGKPSPVLLEIWQAAQRVVQHTIRLKQQTGASYEELCGMLCTKAQFLIDIHESSVSLDISSSLAMLLGASSKGSMSEWMSLDSSVELRQEISQIISDVVRFFVSPFNDVASLRAAMEQTAFSTLLRCAGFRSFSLLMNKTKSFPVETIGSATGVLGAISAEPFQSASLPCLIKSLRELQTAVPSSPVTAVTASSPAAKPKQSQSESSDLVLRTLSRSSVGHYLDGLYAVSSELKSGLRTAFEECYAFNTQHVVRTTRSRTQRGGQTIALANWGLQVIPDDHVFLNQIGIFRVLQTVLDDARMSLAEATKYVHELQRQQQQQRRLLADDGHNQSLPTSPHPISASASHASLDSATVEIIGNNNSNSFMVEAQLNQFIAELEVHSLKQLTMQTLAVVHCLSAQVASCNDDAASCSGRDRMSKVNRGGGGGNGGAPQQQRQQMMSEHRGGILARQLRKSASGPDTLSKSLFDLMYVELFVALKSLLYTGTQKVNAVAAAAGVTGCNLGSLMGEYFEKSYPSVVLDQGISLQSPYPTDGGATDRSGINATPSTKGIGGGTSSSSSSSSLLAASSTAGADIDTSSDSDSSVGGAQYACRILRLLYLVSESKMCQRLLSSTKWLSLLVSGVGYGGLSVQSRLLRLLRRLLYTYPDPSVLSAYIPQSVYLPREEILSADAPFDDDDFEMLIEEHADEPVGLQCDENSSSAASSSSSSSCSSTPSPFTDSQTAPVYKLVRFLLDGVASTLPISRESLPPHQQFAYAFLIYLGKGSAAIPGADKTSTTTTTTKTSSGSGSSGSGSSGSQSDMCAALSAECVMILRVLYGVPAWRSIINDVLHSCLSLNNNNNNAVNNTPSSFPCESSSAIITEDDEEEVGANNSAVVAATDSNMSSLRYLSSALCVLGGGMNRVRLGGLVLLKPFCLMGQSENFANKIAASYHTSSAMMVGRSASKDSSSMTVDVVLMERTSKVVGGGGGGELGGSAKAVTDNSLPSTASSAAVSAVQAAAAAATIDGSISSDDLTLRSRGSSSSSSSSGLPRVVPATSGGLAVQHSTRLMNSFPIRPIRVSEGDILPYSDVPFLPELLPADSMRVLVTVVSNSALPWLKARITRTDTATGTSVAETAAAEGGDGGDGGGRRAGGDTPAPLATQSGDSDDDSDSGSITNTEHPILVTAASSAAAITTTTADTYRALIHVMSFKAVANALQNSSAHVETLGCEYTDVFSTILRLSVNTTTHNLSTLEALEHRFVQLWDAYVQHIMSLPLTTTGDSATLSGSQSPVPTSSRNDGLKKSNPSTDSLGAAAAVAAAASTDSSNRSIFDSSDANSRRRESGMGSEDRSGGGGGGASFGWPPPAAAAVGGGFRIGGGPGVGGLFGARQVSEEAQQAALGQLLEMGMPQEWSEFALRRTGYNVELAINMCLEHGDEMDQMIIEDRAVVEQMRQQQQLQQQQAAAAAEAQARLSRQGSVARGLLGRQGGAIRRSRRSSGGGGDDDDEGGSGGGGSGGGGVDGPQTGMLVRQLADMGFPAPWCIRTVTALAAAGQPMDLDSAMAWILAQAAAGELTSGGGGAGDDIGLLRALSGLVRGRSSRDRESGGGGGGGAASLLGALLGARRAEERSGGAGRDASAATAVATEEIEDDSALSTAKVFNPLSNVCGLAEVSANLTCSALRGGFPSVGCRGYAASAGKWYYEVTLLTSGCIQMGWANTAYTGGADQGNGVGDDGHSWSYDGWRTYLWHEVSVEWGAHWSAGDVVGCAVDLDNKTMSFFLNGLGEEVGMGMAYKQFAYGPSGSSSLAGGIYPCASFNRHEKIRFNFGEIPFKFPPKAAEGYQPFAMHIEQTRMSTQLYMQKTNLVVPSSGAAVASSSSAMSKNSSSGADDETGESPSIEPFEDSFEEYSGANTQSSSSQADRFFQVSDQSKSNVQPEHFRYFTNGNATNKLPSSQEGILAELNGVATNLSILYCRMCVLRSLVTLPKIDRSVRRKLLKFLVHSDAKLDDAETAPVTAIMQLIQLSSGFSNRTRSYLSTMSIYPPLHVPPANLGSIFCVGGFPLLNVLRESMSEMVLSALSTATPGCIQPALVDAMCDSVMKNLSKATDRSISDQWSMEQRFAPVVQRDGVLKEKECMSIPSIASSVWCTGLLMHHFTRLLSRCAAVTAATDSSSSSSSVSSGRGDEGGDGVCMTIGECEKTVSTVMRWISKLIHAWTFSLRAKAVHIKLCAMRMLAYVMQDGLLPHVSMILRLTYVVATDLFRLFESDRYMSNALYMLSVERATMPVCSEYLQALLELSSTVQELGNITRSGSRSSLNLSSLTVLGGVLEEREKERDEDGNMMRGSQSSRGCDSPYSPAVPPSTVPPVPPPMTQVHSPFAKKQRTQSPFPGPSSGLPPSVAAPINSGGARFLGQEAALCESPDDFDDANFNWEAVSGRIFVDKGGWDTWTGSVTVLAHPALQHVALQSVKAQTGERQNLPPDLLVGCKVCRTVRRSRLLSDLDEQHQDASTASSSTAGSASSQPDSEFKRLRRIFDRTSSGGSPASSGASGAQERSDAAAAAEDTFEQIGTVVSIATWPSDKPGSAREVVWDDELAPRSRSGSSAGTASSPSSASVSASAASAGGVTPSKAPELVRWGANLGTEFDVTHCTVRNGRVANRYAHPISDTAKLTSHGFGLENTFGLILRVRKLPRRSAAAAALSSRGMNTSSPEEGELRGEDDGDTAAAVGATLEKDRLVAIVEYPDFNATVFATGEAWVEDGTWQLTEQRLLSGSINCGWECKFGSPEWRPGCTFNLGVSRTCVDPTDPLCGVMTGEHMFHVTALGKRMDIVGNVSIQRARLFTFDSAAHASNITLSQDKLSACRTSSGQGCAFGTVGFTAGVHFWEFKVEQADAGSVFVGVCSKPAESIRRLGSSFFSRWMGSGFVNNRAAVKGLQRNSSSLSLGGVAADRASVYGDHFHTGDTVGVLLDMNRGRLSFYLDGIKYGEHTIAELGEACDGLAAPHKVIPHALFPVVGLARSSDRVTLTPRWLSSVGADAREELHLYTRAWKLLSSWNTERPSKHLAPYDEHIWIYREAWRNYNAWMTDSKLRVRTRCRGASGVLPVLVDISQRACAEASIKLGLPTALFSGDHVLFSRSSGKTLDQKEEAVILGAYNGTLWYRMDAQQATNDGGGPPSSPGTPFATSGSSSGSGDAAGGLTESGSLAWCFGPSDIEGMTLLRRRRNTSFASSRNGDNNNSSYMSTEMKDFALPRLPAYRGGLLSLFHQSGAIVRLGLEIDTSDMVCSIPAEKIVWATERRVNSSNIARYRVLYEGNYGWISERMRGGAEELMLTRVKNATQEERERALSEVERAAANLGITDRIRWHEVDTLKEAMDYWEENMNRLRNTNKLNLPPPPHPTAAAGAVKAAGLSLETGDQTSYKSNNSNYHHQQQQQPKINLEQFINLACSRDASSQWSVEADMQLVELITRCAGRESVSPHNISSGSIVRAVQEINSGDLRSPGPAGATGVDFAYTSWAHGLSLLKGVAVDRILTRAAVLRTANLVFGYALPYMNMTLPEERLKFDVAGSDTDVDIQSTTYKSPFGSDVSEGSVSSRSTSSSSSTSSFEAAACGASDSGLESSVSFGSSGSVASRSAMVWMPSCNARRLRAMRRLLFSQTKSLYWESILDATTTPTPLHPDEYEDPREMKQLKVNRVQANITRLATVPSQLERLKASVFGQLHKEMRNWSVQQFRRSYVAKGHGGQKRAFKIKFIGEGVNDYGGPYRAVFEQIVDELQNDSVVAVGRKPSDRCLLPFFIPSANKFASLGSNQDKFVMSSAAGNSPIFQEMMQFFGRLVGTATRHNMNLALNLSSLVWRPLVRLGLNRNDLDSVDSLSANLLTTIAEQGLALEKQIASSTRGQQGEGSGTSSSSSSAAAATVELPDEWEDITFCATMSDGRRVPLCEGGADIKLNATNWRQFITLTEQCRLRDGASLLRDFRLGLASVIPVELFPLFTAAELEHLISGDTHVDVNIIRQSAEYEDISPDDPVVGYFWQVLVEMSHEERSLFLRFVWARSRMPSAAQDLPMNFKLQGAQGAAKEHPDQYLPHAQTCFFSLTLPPYSSKAILREKLLYAIQNSPNMDADVRLHNAEGWAE